MKLGRGAAVAITAMMALLGGSALGADGSDPGASLSLIWAAPFAGLLLCIALCPLLAPHFWEHHFGKVSAFWAACFVVPFWMQFGAHETLHRLFHVYLLDYLPFIVLLGALFIVAGGILIKGSFRGTPATNTAFLVVGTLLASWIGTTGASMLMIRPVLRANRERKSRVHTVVFFIFLVSNIGGSLTPLGDPPLFLGFLRGVDFFWTALHIWPETLLVTGLLVGAYFALDSFLYRRDGPLPPRTDAGERFGVGGSINFLFFAGIIVAVLLSGSLAEHPGFFDAQKVSEKVSRAQGLEGEVRVLLGGGALGSEGQRAAFAAHRDEVLSRARTATELRTEAREEGSRAIEFSLGRVPLLALLRDGVILLMALLSLLLTPREIRARNGFSWGPIKEVAKLFAGIFATMLPALMILQAGEHGALAAVVKSVTTPARFFWTTGLVSSFLDNAPTYLVFFQTAQVTPMAEFAARGAWGAVDPVKPGVVDMPSIVLAAISAGAVFMGANSYIGNGPNFMVRAIAESEGVRMPSFFGYIARWSLPVLIPIFVLVTWLCFGVG